MDGHWHSSRRLAVWVDREGDAWYVTARVGGHDGRRVVHVRDSEKAATKLVDRLKTTSLGAGQQWRDIIATYRSSPG